MDYLVENGIATLYGQVESICEAALALSHVKNIDGVDRAINRMSIK